MSSLPPDLDRLGDELTRAASRTLAARRRRRRVAIGGVVGAVAFAVLTPTALGPAVRDYTRTPLVSYTLPRGCEHPRGNGFRLPRCEAAEPAVSHRPYAWR